MRSKFRHPAINSRIKIPHLNVLQQDFINLIKDSSRVLSFELRSYYSTMRQINYFME